MRTTGDIEPADPDAPMRHPLTGELMFTFSSCWPFGDSRRTCMVTYTDPDFGDVRTHGGAGNTIIWEDQTTGARVSEPRCDVHTHWPPPHRGQALADCLLDAQARGDPAEMERMRAAMAPGDVEAVVGAVVGELGRRAAEEFALFLSLGGGDAP